MRSCTYSLAQYSDRFFLPDGVENLVRQRPRINMQIFTVFIFCYISKISADMQNFADQYANPCIFNDRKVGKSVRRMIKVFEKM
ncbi:MAG: hypothetical protein DRI57_09020 [Deltaproteobacteria bacterium]|nr:MAG: hypothetical protein DRI57_09020 [Deltaproteobacteria bacterium]